MKIDKMLRKIKRVILLEDKVATSCRIKKFRIQQISITIYRSIQRVIGGTEKNLLVFRIPNKRFQINGGFIF